ncbi:hypothetical protein LXT21_33410 [Myxococcus sp. K38C18041901]|uniref:hypothetical protein n=1 Tax=Myxococcus guangdongensis TaxID=2906760 RepID=UPI0020A7EF64|nr:hypothetical protein [Myxococcus guangdongensis]MCP3063684.1 hypothetical protein [Myxococcus guangdongensis]
MPSRIPKLSNPPTSPSYRPPNPNAPRGTHPTNTVAPQRQPPQAPGPAPRFPQGPVPPMAQGNAAPPLRLDNTAALTHGIPSSHVGTALANGRLSSAYHREGPNGRYSRQSDMRGGGALGVYTRAQGTQQDSWQAQGYGVGSNPNTVQMVLNPTLLQNNNRWRASTTDNDGRVPGSIPADQNGLPPGNPLHRASLWSKQNEAARNNDFNRTVNGPNPSYNNEQLHWQHIPLQNNLRGMVTTSQNSFDTVMQQPSAWRSGLPLPSGPNGLQGLGYVNVGTQRVPVVQVAPDSSQASALRQGGISGPDGKVR